MARPELTLYSPTTITLRSVRPACLGDYPGLIWGRFGAFLVNEPGADPAELKIIVSDGSALKPEEALEALGVLVVQLIRDVTHHARVGGAL